MGTVGDISSFSSYVSADDNGVQRPDFCAPGVSVVSGYNSYDTNQYNNGSVSNALVCGIASENYLSGHTSLCGAMCGTSMSCPNAVGVIALLLQKNPNLTVNKIREIISLVADNDSYTEASPNRFGSGKLNALNALISSPEGDGIIYNKKYDIDGDGRLTIEDVTTLVNYLLGR